MKVQRKKYLKAINNYSRRNGHNTLGEHLYFEFKLYRLADTRNMHAQRCFENLVELVDE